MNFLKIGSCLFFLCSLVACNKGRTLTTKDFTTVFEKTAGLETSTYPEIIDFYKQLASYRMCLLIVLFYQSNDLYSLLATATKVYSSPNILPFSSTKAKRSTSCY